MGLWLEILLVTFQTLCHPQERARPLVTTYENLKACLIFFHRVSLTTVLLSDNRYHFSNLTVIYLTCNCKALGGPCSREHMASLEDQYRNGGLELSKLTFTFLNSPSVDQKERRCSHQAHYYWTRWNNDTSKCY